MIAALFHDHLGYIVGRYVSLSARGDDIWSLVAGKNDDQKKKNSRMKIRTLTTIDMR